MKLLPKMTVKDVFSVLEPHAMEIRHGGADLGLSHNDYCEDGSDVPSMFLIKSTGASETFIDNTG